MCVNLLCRKIGAACTINAIPCGEQPALVSVNEQTADFPHGYERFCMQKIQSFFLSGFQYENNTIRRKAQALLYYNFLMLVLLFLLVVVYAAINPQGFVKGAIGAGSISVLVLLSIFFIHRGKLGVAVTVYLLPTIIVVIAARFMKAATLPHTGFTAYLYYNFYIIVFMAVFGQKRLVPLTTLLFIVANVVYFIVVKDRLDPVSLEIATTGIANSTPALLITGVVSYINVSLSGYSNQQHKEEAAENRKQYDYISSIFLSIKNIAGSLQQSVQQFNQTSQKLTGSTQSQAALVEESSASMEEIAAAIEKVSVDAGVQAGSVNTIEETMNGLNSLISDVSIRADNIMKESEKSIRQGDDAAGLSERAVERMKSINESAEKIRDIIKLITEIADQTNLLALNASIESARAGESGRGFAVVADEISKLADSSTGSAKEISSLINDTVQNIKDESEMFIVLHNHINDIRNTLKISNSLSREMNDVAARQLKLSDSVKEQVHNVNSLSGSISVATQEQASTTGELSRSIDTINEITQTNAAVSEDLSRVTGDLVASVEKLLEIINQSPMQADPA